MKVIYDITTFAASIPSLPATLPTPVLTAEWADGGDAIDGSFTLPALPSGYTDWMDTEGNGDIGGFTLVQNGRVVEDSAHVPFDETQALNDDGSTEFSFYLLEHNDNPLGGLTAAPIDYDEWLPVTVEFNRFVQYTSGGSTVYALSPVATVVLPAVLTTPPTSGPDATAPAAPSNLTGVVQKNDVKLEEGRKGDIHQLRRLMQL